MTEASRRRFAAAPSPHRLTSSPSLSTGHLWAPIVESGNKLYQIGEIEEEKDESSQADCSKPVIVIF